MRRLTGLRAGDQDERGATLLIVAVALFSLLVMSALVVDVGALVQERRTLQNGADAAALAVAKDCATTGCGPYATTAGGYADANADDDHATAEEVCGFVPAPAPVALPACTNPPAVGAGVGYVRVTTRTRTAGGSDQVPFNFAALVGLSGSTIRRQATVAWGGPAALTSALPLTFSLCEFNTYTADGTAYASPPPYATWPAERTIYFHDTTGATPCPQGPSGADLPGGFGWLKTSTDCWAASSVNDWYDDKTGRPPPNSCDPSEMSALVGNVISIPIYDQTNGLTGSNGQYHIKGYAAFYLTGYSIEGQFKERSLVTGNFPCSGSQSCISGFFVNGQLVPGGTIGGPSMGVTTISVIG